MVSAVMPCETYKKAIMYMLRYASILCKTQSWLRREIERGIDLVSTSDKCVIAVHVGYWRIYYILVN